jgi:trans-aconitate methyltransferase
VAKKKKSYEIDGTKYRDASSHQREWGQKLISSLKLHGSESILDLGCGDGILTKMLSENVPNGNTIGIDASESMINAAKEFETNRLTFIKMNIDEIKFTDEFDLIFSNATLHWIKNHSKLLSNCYAALKLNGSIRFNFAGDGNCSNFFSVVKEVMSLDKYRQYFINFDWPWYMPSLREYQQLIDQFEFKNLVIWAENADRHFTNSEEMIKWIEQPSLVPFLAQLDKENKVFFRNDVVDKMIVKTMQIDGTCFETFRRINIHAIKK